MASDLGADLFYSFPGGPWQHDTLRRPRTPEDDATAIPTDLLASALSSRAHRARNHHAIGCDFLDHTLAINSDGTTHPCCYIAEPRDSIGHIASDADPFNTDAVHRLRRFVTNLSAETQTGPSPCASCGSLALGHIPDQLNFETALQRLRHASAR